ncbi:MAG TPA: rhodanese-like domain-containing protein [Thermoanaerobaculia bacterium]
MMTFLAALLFAATLDTTTTLPVPRISVAEAHALQEKGEAVFVDVRGSVPFELGHIQGAVSMPLGLINQRAGELAQDKTIITYCSCRSEESSLEAGAALRKLGFTKVAALTGGYPAWKTAGHATATSGANAVAPPPMPEMSPSPAASGGRLAPPAAVTCNHNNLTVYAGEVTQYKRAQGRTEVTIKTDSDTVETVIVQAPEQASYLIMAEPFGKGDWSRIERKKGVIRPGMRVHAWVCTDGKPVLDWRPGETGSAAR